MKTDVCTMDRHTDGQRKNNILAIIVWRGIKQRNEKMLMLSLSRSSVHVMTSTLAFLLKESNAYSYSNQLDVIQASRLYIVVACLV